MQPLVEPASSPTFCSSLHTCSSHGFSSLQSPSNFPSLLSDDSNQQIEAFQPLILDSAELCGCALHHCSCEALLGTTQDESVSQSNANVSLFQREPVSGHGKEANKFAVSNQRLPQKTFGQDCLDCPKKEGIFQETFCAEPSMSVPSKFWLLQEDTENCTLDRENKEEPVIVPTFVDESDSLLCSSVPDVAEISDLLPTNDINYVYCENAYGFRSQLGYDFNSQIAEHCSLESHEAHPQIDNTAQINAQNRNSHCRSFGTMPLDNAADDKENLIRAHMAESRVLEVVSSVLTSSKQNSSTIITENGDADDKENIIHTDANKVLKVRLLNNLALSRPVESKLECIKEANQAASQEVHKYTKTMYSTCKERIINPYVFCKASKENISPHAFTQSHKRVGRLNTDPNGWLCPRDGKKNFKPKPRQILLDKWLAKQR